eukprot:gnl/TRDRNA2_/TRDRNA2_81523_c0_seq1.p1 gnl/TRDRNA2_/TRDRNA2_81523_c0~~gnl/TRDRNA2_/TRDRNA2_81523_c0_seq1.p1  ORF type:complete len:231 (-),score=48.26 gnl/TRDRNA2_/TRDRNA2_81523_c0_seq1:135-827(-)
MGVAFGAEKQRNELPAVAIGIAGKNHTVLANALAELCDPSMYSRDEEAGSAPARKAYTATWEGCTAGANIVVVSLPTGPPREQAFEHAELTTVIVVADSTDAASFQQLKAWMRAFLSKRRGGTAACDVLLYVLNKGAEGALLCEDVAAALGLLYGFERDDEMLDPAPRRVIIKGVQAKTTGKMAADLREGWDEFAAQCLMAQEESGWRMPIRRHSSRNSSRIIAPPKGLG